MIFRIHLQLPLKLRKKTQKYILWFNIFYPCQIRSILSSPVSGRRSKMWLKEAFRVSCKTKITDLSSSLKVSCCHVIAPCPGAWCPRDKVTCDNLRLSFKHISCESLGQSSDNPIETPLLSISSLHSTPDQGLFKPLTKAAFLFSQLIHHPIVFPVDCGLPSALSQVLLVIWSP